MAAKRKKRASAKKGVPHCKKVKQSNGKKRMMCWDKSGKITSKKKVDAYNKRKRTRRAA
jgi:hypothetical protein